MNPKKLLCALIVCSAFFSMAVAADNSPFKLDTRTDALLIGGGAALAATGFAVDHFCLDDTWNNDLLDKNDIPFFDRWCVRGYSHSLDIAGDIMQYTAFLLPCVLFATPNSEWTTIAVMYAESALFAWGIKENLKNVTARYRPYMYSDNPSQDEIDSGDFDRSFPSAHTAAAFNGAAFTSYVFAHYFPESKWKIPVTAASFSLATATAAVRISSGNHFLSDVVAGAAIGTATGLLIPWLHLVQDSESPVQVSAGLGSFTVSIAY